VRWKPFRWTGRPRHIEVMKMFSVKWVVRDKESDPVEVENSILTDLDRVVASSQEGLVGMRLRHIARPPDGFIVTDNDGKEVRRWFAKRPDEVGGASKGERATA
jgi:hypothetical protein